MGTLQSQKNNKKIEDQDTKIQKHENTNTTRPTRHEDKKDTKIQRHIRQKDGMIESYKDKDTQQSRSDTKTKIRKNKDILI